MLGFLPRIWNESDAQLRGRLIAVWSLLIGANALVWVWAFVEAAVKSSKANGKWVKV